MRQASNHEAGIHQAAVSVLEAVFEVTGCSSTSVFDFGGGSLRILVMPVMIPVPQRPPVPGGSRLAVASIRREPHVDHRGSPAPGGHRVRRDPSSAERNRSGGVWPAVPADDLSQERDMLDATAETALVVDACHRRAGGGTLRSLRRGHRPRARGAAGRSMRCRRCVPER